MKEARPQLTRRKLRRITGKNCADGECFSVNYLRVRRNRPRWILRQSVSCHRLPNQLLTRKTRVRTVLKGYYRKASEQKRTILGESMHGRLA